MTDTTKPLDQLNGLELPALIDLIETESDPSPTQLAVVTRWRGALLTQTAVESAQTEPVAARDVFRPDCDAPAGRLGFGAAPTPHDHLLTGLTSAVVWAYVSQATIRGIDLWSIEVRAEAEVEARTFLGLAGERPFSALYVEVDLDCDAEPALRAQLHRCVAAHCEALLTLAEDAELWTDEEDDAPQSNAA